MCMFQPQRQILCDHNSGQTQKTAIELEQVDNLQDKHKKI